MRPGEFADVETKPELGQLQSVGLLFQKRRHEFNFGLKYDLTCH